MSHPANGASTARHDIPRGNAAGFVKYLRYDLLSGFLVFLIALPLCLGIAKASGFPPIAGIFTAVVGSLITTFISNSELTIKGPAAGLIVIVVGCVDSFREFAPDDTAAYRMALAVGVAAAVLQIVLGLLRAGILGEFFPLSAVHGMLAAIGVIIISKQVPVALGYSGKLPKEPLELLKDIPHFIHEMNPEIALIGAFGLLIMFTWPLLQSRLKQLKPIPAAVICLLVTVPLGMYFDLLHKHTYSIGGAEYSLDDSFLVKMPTRVFGMFDEITYPDFSVLNGDHAGTAWWWVMMFFIIGSLESILSAKAVDVIDPWKRKTNLNRDILGVGTANLCSAMIGGLPMISEIVRSKANIDNGARTRFADMWHGLFLLACVALIPTVLHQIPYAALAAMLIFTGFRLTHPREFIQTYRIGSEQLLVFVGTLVGVLATDLLWGVVIGIAIEAAIQLINGVPIRSLIKPRVEVGIKDDNTVVVSAKDSANFSNWILLRRQLVRLGLEEKQNVSLDLSETKLVDHSVMEKLHQLQGDFDAAGLNLEVTGLDGHLQTSEHEYSARKRALARLKRLTVVASSELEQELSSKFVELGASGYTSIPCYGAGRHATANGEGASNSQVRLETVVPEDVGDKILDYLRYQVTPKHRIMAVVEVVQVLRRSQFD